MKPLYVLLVGVVVGWAASGVDWSREAVGQDGELQFEQSKPASIEQPEGATPKSVRPADVQKFGVGQVEVYKALTRVEIEELGGRKKSGGFSGFHDFSHLNAGLNTLANTGWFLVVIEPAHNYPISGPGNAQSIEPSVYIFEKR